MLPTIFLTKCVVAIPLATIHRSIAILFFRAGVEFVDILPHHSKIRTVATGPTTDFSNRPFEINSEAVPQHNANTTSTL